MKLKIVTIMILIIIACAYNAAYAGQAATSEGDINAQTLGEIASRNQMLMAKNDIWNNGTTTAMDMCSDAVYVSAKSPHGLILEGGRTIDPD